MAIIKAKVKKNSGFAVIFVLAFIATIVVILADVLYQTQLVAKNTMETQNQIQARATALTGVSIARTLIKFHTMVTAKGMSALPLNLPKSMYAGLNNIKIGRTTLAANKALTDLIPAEVLKTLGQIPGYFVLNVSIENCKFNLNLLRPGFSAYADAALLNLFSTPDAREVFQIYHVDPNTLIQNMKEYVNTIKRPLLSVEDIRMVDGFQYDDIYNMYSPYFTVWPNSAADLTKTPPLNINCAPIELLAGLFRSTPNDSINPVVWQSFSDVRGDDDAKFKSFPDLSEWTDNNKIWFTTGNLKEMMERLVGFQNTVYRIESKGVIDDTEQTLTVIMHVDENGKSVIDYNQWSS